MIDSAGVEIPAHLAQHLRNAGAEERWIKLSYGKMRYVEAGSGPPLVVLHSAYWLTGADRWLAHIPAWAKRFRVLCLDLPGWGPGDAPKLEYSAPVHVTGVIRELLDALEIDRCFLVGHGFGGQIALKLTAQSPQRVHACVAAAISTRNHAEPLVSVAGRVDSVEALRAAIVSRIGEVPGIDYDELAQWSWRSVQAKPDLLEMHAQQLAWFADPQVRYQNASLNERWNEIETPILLAWPDGDPAAPVADAAEYLLAMKSASMRLCPGNHFFPNQYPADFTNIVNAFFDDELLRRAS